MTNKCVLFLIVASLIFGGCQSSESARKVKLATMDLECTIEVHNRARDMNEVLPIFKTLCAPESKECALMIINKMHSKCYLEKLKAEYLKDE